MVSRIKISSQVGQHVDKTVKYQCKECDIVDVLCNGASVLAGGRVTIVNSATMISFSFPSYEDGHSCVYMGIFKKEDKLFKKVLAVLDNASVAVTELPPMKPPGDGQQFEAVIAMSCEECTIVKVSVNGIQLEAAPSRRTGTGPTAYYLVSPTSITIRISEFSSMYEGVYQAVFEVHGETVTKTLMEIRNAKEKVDESGGSGDDAATTEATGSTGGTESESTKPEGDATTTVAGDAVSVAPADAAP